jgi:hypothetical protein
MKIVITFLLICTSNILLAGGNISGGGNPYKVSEGALRLLLEGDGLKKAMLNYVDTLPLKQIEDGQVRESLTKMISNGSLRNDIINSKYIASNDCKDSHEEMTPASTLVGLKGSDICFNTQKLVTAYKGFNDEEVMINLASLAFHEHAHHFQKSDKKKIKENEEEANRIAGYILITAKFVQLPLLKWTNPSNEPIEFQTIQAMFEAIRAKEKAFIAPKPSDYKNYPDFQGQKDKGVVRLLPREKYDEKMSIRGGGAYYSFVDLTHEYGYGSDLGLEQKYISSGFAGCDFGYMVNLGNIELSQANEAHPALDYLLNFKPAIGEPEIRKQQSRDDFTENGFNYTRRTKFQVNDSFALRSINFDRSDILVVFKITRMDTDGSIILAWKKIKDFPVPSCR